MAVEEKNEPKFTLEKLNEMLQSMPTREEYVIYVGKEFYDTVDQIVKEQKNKNDETKW